MTLGTCVAHEVHGPRDTQLSISARVMFRCSKWLAVMGVSGIRINDAKYIDFTVTTMCAYHKVLCLVRIMQLFERKISIN